MKINKSKTWALNGVSLEARRIVETISHEENRKYGEVVSDIILGYNDLKKYIAKTEKMADFKSVDIKEIERRINEDIKNYLDKKNINEIESLIPNGKYSRTYKNGWIATNKPWWKIW